MHVSKKSLAKPKRKSRKSKKSEEEIHDENFRKHEQKKEKKLSKENGVDQIVKCKTCINSVKVTLGLTYQVDDGSWEDTDQKFETLTEYVILLF
jgi:hypothetical protein